MNCPNLHTKYSSMVSNIDEVNKARQRGKQTRNFDERILLSKIVPCTIEGKVNYQEYNYFFLRYLCNNDRYSATYLAELLFNGLCIYVLINCSLLLIFVIDNNGCHVSNAKMNVTKQR